MSDDYAIRIEDAEVFQLLNQLQARGDNLSPIMKEISGFMHRAVMDNFEQEGRPKWPALAPATIAKREKAGHWPGKILQVSGQLKSSLTPAHNSTQAIVQGGNMTTEKGATPYPIFLQFGTRKMPARPFMKLTQSDIGEIKFMLMQYLFKGQ
jgi:phage gpG-like protein